MLPGFVPLACSRRISWEQGRAVRFKPSLFRRADQARETFNSPAMKNKCKPAVRSLRAKAKLSTPATERQAFE
jgi:hypothetical protein